MTPRSGDYYSGGAGETAPGVVMLRQLWDIPTGSRPREQAPSDVNTDIYSTPHGGKNIPSRRGARYRRSR